MVLRAAQRVVSVEGFDDMLDQTRDRVDEIEGMSSSLRALFPQHFVKSKVHYADAW